MVVGQHRRGLIIFYPRPIATLTDIGIAVGSFAVAALVAAALGAANTGTALGVGQVAFVFVVTALLVLRD